METPLSGKVALVVGASHGIGRAYALGLARAGARVAGTGRRLLPDGADQRRSLGVREGSPIAADHGVAVTAQIVRAEGGEMLAFKFEMLDRHRIPSLVEEITANLGPIDILVVNSGWANRAEELEVPDEHWDLAYAINVRGPYELIRAVAPGMIDRRSGSIVLLSTRASLNIPASDPAHKGLLAYGCSRAAMNRMVTHMAEEFRPHNVSINAMSPGIIDELTGGKEPKVEEWAPQIVHLAQQTPDTMTGQWLHTTEFGTTWP